MLKVILKLRKKTIKPRTRSRIHLLRVCYYCGHKLALYLELWPRRPEGWALSRFAAFGRAMKFVNRSSG